MKNLKSVFDLLLFPFVFVLFLTTSLSGASSEPVVSISPTSNNIVWGTTSVDLNLTASPEVNVSSITVGYTNSYDGSTGTIGIAVNTPSSILTIGTAGMPSGTVFNITLDSVTGDDGNQSVGGIGTGTATITITNQAPIANDKNYSFSINDAPFTGNIMTDPTADSDPDDGNLITLVSHNSTSPYITINMTNGNFEYTPTTDFCGIYSFDYNITDGDLNSTATITIDNIQNTLDKLVDDSYPINRKNQVLTGNVITNDTNQTYELISFTSPTYGSVKVLDKNGSFEYTPDNIFIGDVTFDYTVTDGTCSTATATVTVKITNMCNNIIPFDLCAGPIPDTIVVDDPQVYSFELNTSVMLDLNLTNTGKKLLEYDFRAGDCDSLFAEQTTSYLPQGAKIDIQKEYPAATYFLGLGVGQNETDILLSICYNTNISGYDGQAYSHIGINDINSTPDSNDWYDDFPNITTKVVNKPFDIRASYLDENQSTVEYDGRYDKNGEVGMSVILSMAQNSCEKIDNSIVGTMILDHQDWYKESINTIINIPYAAKKKTITHYQF